MKNNPAYVFSHTTFLQALEEWEQEQIEHFPQQAERIQITVLAMQDFMRSKQVKEHKMLMRGEPLDFVIQQPVSLKASEQ